MQAAAGLSQEQLAVLLAESETMAGRLRELAEQQQALLVSVQKFNHGSMPLTTAAIHPALVRCHGGTGLATLSQSSL